MNEKDLLYMLLDKTFTSADFHRRLTLLRSYLDSTLFSEGKEQNLKTFFTAKNIPVDDQKSLSELPPSFFSSFTRANAYHLLSKVENLFKTIPVITVYLPFDPMGDMTQKAGAWFRTYMHQLVVLDIHLATSFVGGAGFAYKGSLYDFSLSYYLRKHKSDISQILEKYGDGHGGKDESKLTVDTQNSEQRAIVQTASK